MTNPVVRPFAGFGPLDFGMTRAASHAILGPPAHRYRRSAWVGQLTDVYTEFGLTLDYGDDGNLEAVEAISPARPIVEAMDVLGRPSSAVVEGLAENSCASDWELGLLSVPRLGIALFTPSGQASSGPFLSMSAFWRGVSGHEVFAGSGQERLAGSLEDPLVVEPDRLGPARLGMTVDQLRRLLGEGMSTVYFGRPTDIFFGVGIVAQYDAGVVCRLVAVSRSKATVDGLPTLGVPFGEFVTAAAGAGLQFEVSEGEVQLHQGRVRVWSSRPESPELRVSGVSVTAGSAGTTPGWVRR
ncbi:hypothetical protein ABZ153_21580 [Streptomyces sp. NPDC006290]|uniref:hypothetical protein n=1 Tax=Streptomyces sp. NPDC006290 TaxID=3156745 RepID=UPI0033B74123